MGPLLTSSSASSEAIRIEANFFLWGLFYFTFFHYGSVNSAGNREPISIFCSVDIFQQRMQKYNLKSTEI